jgi:DNA repair protein RadA/Sms
MGKTLTKFVCPQCGCETNKWMGRCPGCGEWNTLQEEIIEKRVAAAPSEGLPAVALSAVPAAGIKRFSTGIHELDRVLGGGVVPGSLILLGGDPGIGKSTLLLQVAHHIAQSGQKVLYLSGEESFKQIRLRANRLNIDSDDIYLLNEQNMELLEGYVKELDPGFIIIDSIQTVYAQDLSSIPGSVAQLRECTARLINIAKKTDKSVFLVGHVTKDGALAGPKVLEHMVDVVVYFEGEKNFSFRILRGVKNRFGSTNELGILEMSGQGLIEVADPSYLFLSDGTPGTGTAVSTSFEGSRPLLIEIQALAAASGPGYARRMASGIDQNRLSLIIAVLEKIKGYNLGQYDVFLKVTGGVYIKDPSVDLAIAAAILSSYKEKPLPPDTVFIGELSLSGQMRPVPFMEARLKEIQKMGFRCAVVPAGSRRNTGMGAELELIEINSLSACIDQILGG